MPAVLTYGPLKLAYGYFYNLHAAFRDGTTWAGVPEDESWIVSTYPDENELARAEVVDYKTKTVDLFKCELKPEHRKGEVYLDFGVELLYTDRTGSFVPSYEGDDLIINCEMRAQLQQAGLKGWKSLPVKVIDPDKGLQRSPRLYLWTFDRTIPRIRRKIIPASADKCPFCGVGPIVCPSCGRSNNPCPNCKKRWAAADDKHGGEKDPRIKIDRFSARTIVIDPKRWEGSDLLGGNIVTRRVIDFLLSIHAAPFKAEPVPVNVLGLSKAELKRLGTAKAPLPLPRCKNK